MLACGAAPALRAPAAVLHPGPASRLPGSWQDPAVPARDEFTVPARDELTVPAQDEFTAPARRGPSRRLRPVRCGAVRCGRVAPRCL